MSAPRAQVFSFGVLLYELLSREIMAAAVLATARAGDSEICELYAHKARAPARTAQLATEPNSAQSRPSAVAPGAARSVQHPPKTNAGRCSALHVLVSMAVTDY